MKTPSLNLAILTIISLSLLTQVPRAAAGDAPLLTPAEAREVDAVITSMITAGFPDTDKAVVYSGKISVSATFDPGKGPPPLPSSASNTQMSNPNSTTTYGYVFQGLHFKLADGSWVISLSYHFKPGAGDKVNVADATEVKLATLAADAIAAHPFDAQKNAAKYLEKVAPAQRERSIAALNRLVPITMFLKLGPDSLAPAAVLLDRAGWKGAEELSLAISEQRSRNYWQLRPWTMPDPPFDPTGEYPAAQKEEATWKTTQTQFTAEAPAVALRRALFRWCRAQMMAEEPEDVMLSLPTATAATKAAVDPRDPQHNAAKIDALAAGARLPVIAPNATLITRLQSWEARPRMPRMVVTSGNGGLSFSTSFVAPPPAYVPDKVDLDALIALLPDERPTRFNDFSGPRTLGDNALRAVATLLKADPRTLAGFPTEKPWTSTERKAAATAIAGWWKTHRGEFEK